MSEASTIFHQLYCYPLDSFKEVYVLFMDSLFEWCIIGVAPTKSYIEVPKSPSQCVFMIFYEEEHSPISIGASGDIS